MRMAGIDPDSGRYNFKMQILSIALPAMWDGDAAQFVARCLRKSLQDIDLQHYRLRYETVAAGGYFGLSCQSCVVALDKRGKFWVPARTSFGQTKMFCCSAAAAD